VANQLLNTEENKEVDYLKSENPEPKVTATEDVEAV